MHRPGEDIDLFPFYELGGVFRGLRRTRLVIDLDENDLAIRKLAAMLLEVKLHRAGDRLAELGISAAIGQQQPDLDRLCLGERRARERQREARRPGAGHH